MNRLGNVSSWVLLVSTLLGCGDLGYESLEAEAEPEDEAIASVSQPITYTVTNPLSNADTPDPGVIRVIENGRAAYYASYTVGTGNNFPIFRSTDLINWTQVNSAALNVTQTSGPYSKINGNWYRDLWGPSFAFVGSGYQLSFVAKRYDGAFNTASDPGPIEGMGVYLAWAPSMTAQFAPTIGHSHEPFPLGARSDCVYRSSQPRSVDFAKHSSGTCPVGKICGTNCQNGGCIDVARLDQTMFQDVYQNWWTGYAWYTNFKEYGKNLDTLELANHGEHVAIVRSDNAFEIACSSGDSSKEPIFIANPHDYREPGIAGRPKGRWYDALATSCSRCSERLSFFKSRSTDNTPVTSGGYMKKMDNSGAITVPWGVAEGLSVFRRPDTGWYYALMSGSAWDSAHYHVFYVAAPTLEELSINSTSPNRIQGRFLIPSNDPATGEQWSFGHGEAVLGPNGSQWYYLHHGLNATRCRLLNDCTRKLFLSPINFNGNRIVERFPAEQKTVSVVVP